MPARVVVVHDDPEFIDALAEKLGPDTMWFTDPVRALLALESAKTVAFLVTRLQFANRQSVGLSLARVTKAVRPDVRIIFTGAPGQQEYARDLGDFIPEPVRATHVAMVVEWLTDRPAQIENPVPEACP